MMISEQMTLAAILISLDRFSLTADATTMSCSAEYGPWFLVYVIYQKLVNFV